MEEVEAIADPYPANLSSPAEVSELLRVLGVKPSKALGQNFLIDGNILRIMLDLAALDETASVLEIGPGLGVLTEGLLAQGAHVVAVEKDRRLYDYLSARLANHPGLELLHADIMTLDLAALRARGVDRVVANLPYSVGTRAILDLVALDQPPERLVLTLQWDVGERLAAPPGGKAYGVASVLAQARYRVRMEKVISPTCFYPVPQVRSAIIALTRRAAPVLEGRDFGKLRTLVKLAFGQRRKKVVTVLRHGPPGWRYPREDAEAALAAEGIATDARPAIISVSQWCALARRLGP